MAGRKKRVDLSEEIDKLADLIQDGHVIAALNPAGFLVSVADEIKETRAERDELSVRVHELETWIDDLQSGLYVNCVYCGHQYGPGETTPVSMADALKAHVEQCPRHPMSAVRRGHEQLRVALCELLEDDALEGAHSGPVNRGRELLAEMEES